MNSPPLWTRPQISIDTFMMAVINELTFMMAVINELSSFVD